MSEQPRIDYQDTRENLVLAQYVGEAEEPFRLGVESAKAFGQIVSAGILEGLQANASLEAREDYELEQLTSGAVSIQEVQNKNIGVELSSEDKISAEAGEINDKDRERIRSWIDEGLVSLHTWLGSDKSPGKSTPGANRFMTVFNDPKRRRGVLQLTTEGGRTATDKSIQALFAKRGVPELLTITSLRDRVFEAVKPESSAKDEEAVMIQYETVYESPYNRAFGKEGAGRAVTSNLIRMQLFLPKSQAEEALAMITDNPRLVRELADVLMVETIGARESWDKAQPNYEKFKDLNGSVDRIAIRESLMAKPDDSEIVQF
jgi:hypothetical protein